MYSYHIFTMQKEDRFFEGHHVRRCRVFPPKSSEDQNKGHHLQGWKLKPKPKPENPALKEILETQTETDTYLAKIFKT